MMKSCRMLAIVVPSFFISSVSSSASGPFPAPTRFPLFRADTDPLETAGAATPPGFLPLFFFAVSACPASIPGIQSSATPGK